MNTFAHLHAPVIVYYEQSYTAYAAGVGVVLS